MDTPPEETPPAAWYDNLDADLKSHPSITKFKEPGSMAKSYVELERMIGADKVVIPTDKSTPEERAAFYGKLGVPQGPADYEKPLLEGIPDELQMSDGQLEALRVFAHEKNFTNEQFKELVGFYHNAQVTSVENLRAQQNELKNQTETNLRGKWGDAFEAKLDGTKQMINQFFGGKLNETEQKYFAVLANSQGFIEAMADIHGSIKEDILKGQPTLTLTPAQAEEQLNAILGNMEHPYYQDMHPEHNAAVDKVVSLQTSILAGQQ